MEKMSNIRDIQIKTMLRFHLTPKRMPQSGNHVVRSLVRLLGKQAACSSLTGGNVKQHSHREKQDGDFSKH